ncbi:hypothetical protein Tco_1106970 [Tanacetum coccineum]
MEDEIFFHQSKYIKEMLKKFGLEDSKPTKTPMSTKIKLTKDDEADSMDSSKYRCMIENPKTTHLEAVKRIFRYIRGISHLGLWYSKGTEIETVVYVESDHAGDYVDRKSTSGVYTFMGCCLTSWFAKKETALAISMTEAEYVSVRKACQQVLWMKQALINYDIRLDDVPIMCDNKGAIDLSKNPIQHSRTKHIEIRHHFLRDNVQKGNISIEKVASEDNIADIFTKPLKRTKMPSEYQQDYKKTCAYAPKIYNDPNMSYTLKVIYRTLESRYVHEERTINPSFYNDLSDDSVAKFTAIENRQPFNLAYFIIRRMYFFKDRRDKVLPYGMILTRLFKNLKVNMAQGSFDERYKLVPRKVSSLKAKQPKKPPPKRTRNVGKSKRTQSSTSSSTESPPSDNGDFPSTKLYPKSYSRALKDDPNMSKE